VALLDLCWITTAALATWLGWAGPRSLTRATALCVLIGLLGWAASYPVMLLSPSLGGDTHLAEYYVNGFSARIAPLEVAGALAWTFLWFGTVRIARSAKQRGRKRAT
jgi:hypothetical protein